jgi:hypothetical protein
MARKARLQIPGAQYHVIWRGNEQRDIYFDEEDRYTLLLHPSHQPQTQAGGPSVPGRYEALVVDQDRGGS